MFNSELHQRRTFFALTAGALLFGLLIGNSSYAQSSESKPHEEHEEHEELEEIVVKGIRSSLNDAIATKRNADSIVDSIASEDIGKFPTENAAESLQRVTGVQINRARGEGQSVTIRGLPVEFTRVQLNGRLLPSALVSEGGGALGRQFDFRLIPSEFIGQIDVIKSPTAKMQEGGLSGTVNLRTAKPLQIGERQIAGSLQYASHSNRTDPTPRVSFFYNDIFADGRLGVLLGASYTERATEPHEQSLTRYRRRTEDAIGLDLNDNGVIEPGVRLALVDQVFQTINRRDSERYTYNAVIEYQASDRLNLYFDGFHSDIDIVNRKASDLHLNGIPSLLAPDAAIVPGSVVLDQRTGNTSPNGDLGQPIDTLVVAGINGINQRGDGRTVLRDSALDSFAGGFVYSTDSFELNGEVSYSKAEQTFSNPLLENNRATNLMYDVTANTI